MAARWALAAGLAVAAAVLAACGGASPPGGGVAVEDELPSVAERATADLAARLGVAADAVRVVALRRVEWSDACLGVHYPGQVCAQVITSGYWLKLRAQARDYTYHTDTGDRFIATDFAQGATITDPLDLPLAPAPPQARLVTSAGEQAAGIGSYCWSENGAGVCVDKVGLVIPKAAVVARVGERVAVHMGFQPSEAALSAWPLTSGQSLGDDREDGYALWQPQGPETLSQDLAPRPTLDFAADLPPGRYVLMVAALGAEGDVAYGFLVEVAGG